MTEISSIESDDLDKSSWYTEPPTNRKEILWAASFLAATTLIPSSTPFKKKRTYTPIILDAAPSTVILQEEQPPYSEEKPNVPPVSIPAVQQEPPIFQPSEEKANAVPIALVQKPPSPSIDPVLQCSDEVKKKINELWTGIATAPVMKALEITNLGEEIENKHQVHPFALFIALPKERLQVILRNKETTYTWWVIPGVIKGIEKGLVKALSNNRPSIWPDLSTLIPSFAQQMKKDEVQIKQLIQAKKWRDLVDYLFDTKS